jgi:hypothetical protein
MYRCLPCRFPSVSRTRDHRGLDKRRQGGEPGPMHLKGRNACEGRRRRLYFVARGMGHRPTGKYCWQAVASLGPAGAESAVRCQSAIERDRDGRGFAPGSKTSGKAGTFAMTGGIRSVKFGDATDRGSSCFDAMGDKATLPPNSANVGLSRDGGGSG